MAELRIRIELQRRDQGVEPAKLPKLAEEAWRLLRMVAEDSGGVPEECSWVAGGFYEQGIGFDVKLDSPDGVDQATVDGYLRAIDAAAQATRDGNWAARGVRDATILQAAKLADVAGEDETIRIGLLNGAYEPDWRPLPRARAREIIDHFNEEVEYRGTLQGVIHSIFKESDPPYFRLRDFATSKLIRCELQWSAWADVHDALQDKDAAVIVTGWAKAKRIDRRIHMVKVDRLKRGRIPMNTDRLRNFFGSAPEWTGALTSDEFVEKQRAEFDGGEGARVEGAE